MAPGISADKFLPKKFEFNRETFRDNQMLSTYNDMRLNI
jgi:hypothetical protein